MRNWRLAGVALPFDENGEEDDGHDRTVSPECSEGHNKLDEEEEEGEEDDDQDSHQHRPLRVLGLAFQ